MRNKNKKPFNNSKFELLKGSNMCYKTPSTSKL